MIQALLKSKLRRWLTKDPYDIEDLVTSLILGSCEYADPWKGILPFILKARDKDGKTLQSQSLIDHGCVEKVEYEFWNRQGSIEPELLLKIRRKNDKPAWIVIEAKVGSGKSGGASYDPAQFDFVDKDKYRPLIKELKRDLSGDDLITDRSDLNDLMTCRDLRDRLHTRETDTSYENKKRLDWLDEEISKSEDDLKPYLIKNRNRRLLEAIYQDICPNCEVRASDQLAKYWNGISKRAGKENKENAEVLAIVYVTLSYSFPEPEFKETQQEYRIKYFAKADNKDIPLFWRSWYFFAQDMPADAPKIIEDLVALLKEWGWACDEMNDWEEPPPVPSAEWAFFIEWAECPTVPTARWEFSFC